MTTIIEPENYYDEGVIALDMAKLYETEKKLLGERWRKQAAATSYAEQVAIQAEYLSHPDVISFSTKKAEIMRRHQVCKERKEIANKA